VDIVGEAPEELELTILVQTLARRFVRGEKEVADVDVGGIMVKFKTSRNA
jgi:hypothetical protein